MEVNADVPARIVINERTGTIVATARIRIASCAVSHGNLTISIASTLNVSQPSPFSQTGQTVDHAQTDTKVKEEKGTMVALPELPTVEKVAAALNSLGRHPARHDVHVPSHERSRRVAGGTDHPVIWTFRPLQPHVKAADLPIEKLAANPNVSERDKVGQACRQFEAVLLRQILARRAKP